MRFISKQSVSLQALVMVMAAAIVALAPVGELRAAAADSPVPIAMPDLDALDPGARAIIGPAIERFERSRKGAQGVELGQAYGRLGVVFQAWQQGDAALAAYSQAMRLDPADAHWPYYVAVLHERNANYDEALRYYREAYRLDQGYPNTMLRIGETLSALGQRQEAQQAFEQVLEQQPALAAPAMAGLGTLAMQAEDFRQAIDLFERALVLQPEALQLHQRIAQAYLQLGDSNKAGEHIRDRGERGTIANDTWIEIMAAHQYDSAYYVQQGIQAAQQTRMDRALQFFLLALAIDPQDVDAIAHMAVSLGFGERRDETIKLIDQALALDPQHGLANSLKGALLAEAGDHEAAQAYYFRAVSAEAGNVEYRQQFANGLMRLGDYDAAVRQYAEASSMRPDRLDLRYAHAVSLTMAGRCGAAISVIDDAVNINAKVALILNARARIFATCPAASEAQRAIALEDSIRLYDERPDADHSETVAMAMAANGRFDEAMEFQGQAIFEAIKAGDMDSQESLRANMQRYEAMLSADKPW